MSKIIYIEFSNPDTASSFCAKIVRISNDFLRITRVKRIQSNPRSHLIINRFNELKLYKIVRDHLYSNHVVIIPSFYLLNLFDLY